MKLKTYPSRSAWAGADATDYGEYECRECPCEMVFWMEHPDGMGRPHRGWIGRVLSWIAGIFS